MAEEKQAVQSYQKQTTSLSVVVMRACRAPKKRGLLYTVKERCNAPGSWQKRLSLLEQLLLTEEDRKLYQWRSTNWPEVYVDAQDPRVGQPILGNCPCCGAKRPKPEDRGVVWKRERQIQP